MRSLYRIHDRGDRSSTRSASSFYPYQPVRFKSASLPDSLNRSTICVQERSCEKVLPAFYHCSCSCRHPDGRTRATYSSANVNHDCCDYYTTKSTSLPQSVGKVFELTKKERLLDNWIPYTMTMTTVPNRAEPGHRVVGGRRGEMEEEDPNKGKKVHRARPLRGRLKRPPPVENLAHKTRKNPPLEASTRRSSMRTPYNDSFPPERSIRGQKSCFSKLKGFHRNLCSSITEMTPPNDKYQHCWQTLQESSSTSHTRSNKTSPPSVLPDQEPSIVSSEDDFQQQPSIQTSRVQFLRQKFENIESENDKGGARNEITKL